MKMYRVTSLIHLPNSVDGFVRWIRDYDDGSEESKLNRLIQRKKKLNVDWAFPFSEEKLFVLTLSAGLEGYHVNVDGRHVISFPYPTNGSKEVNEEVRKEAEFFGDTVIVPYVDSYDLVVLKTVAVCEYGVRTVSANYIMKGDDDTFVRVDAIIDEAKNVGDDRSLYIGNMNYYHAPLRTGKWAVTYEEWPEGVYPPYANGPGYIISADIANSIVSDFENHKLRLFKMEDVSMGMWVEKLNKTTTVEYVHSLKFCQFGCVEIISPRITSPRDRSSVSGTN